MHVASMSQVYDLKQCVTRLRQAGGSIEMYYNGLQSLWREIDFRRPNPMKCESDIQKFNSIIQEDRVYTFLDGLDDRLDKIRSDVLQMNPFPTVEQAYAHVRREDSRQAVILTGTDVGAVMASRGGNKPFLPAGVATYGPNRSGQLHQAPSFQIMTGEQVAAGSVTGTKQQLSISTSKSGPFPTNVGKPNTTSKPKSQAEGGSCTHCGNSKHTRETCFQLHGYPEWWYTLKARKKQEVTAKGSSNSGQVALVNAEPQLSLIPQVESSSSSSQVDDASLGIRESEEEKIETSLGITETEEVKTGIEESPHHPLVPTDQSPENILEA
ncbi:hypothetical protein Pint_07129 [Pistacia integerrima]|uniref:Uncharacterized protein n=1 Tax=Pistacia integerrima TaxID=434235 RepID=A0ACC0XV01_9ROSI|nr:hypothetical protein Pint_07129 [Pistacia integerrima]